MLAKLFLLCVFITIVSADQICLDQSSFTGVIFGTILGTLFISAGIFILISCCCVCSKAGFVSNFYNDT